MALSLIIQRSLTPQMGGLVCSGIPGRFVPDWVAVLKRNQWPIWCGILNYPLDAIRGHYEAALRHHKGDIDLLVELGSYLFMNSKFGEAKSVFNESKTTEASGYDKNEVRQYWTDSKNKKILFTGKVKKIIGHLGYVIAIPGNFKASFYRTYADLSKLKENDAVKFYVSFNAYGPFARLIEY